MRTITFTIRGILGRKRQSALLLAAIGVFFAFITAALCYFASAKQAQVERRYDLYGRWEAAQYGLTPAEAAAFLREKQPDSAGVATQAGVLVGGAMEPLGSVGQVDAGYLALGRLAPLQGRLPESAGEAALTTNALDSLGYSYTLGQTIELPLMEWDYLEAGDTAARRAAFTLCGVLPAYEIFWNTENQLPVTALLHKDAALPLENPPLQQVFYAYETPGGPALAAGGAAAGAVYNAFAYPEQGGQDLVPFMLVGVCLLLAFFAAAQLFLSALSKRARQRNTLRALGATLGRLRGLYVTEGLFYLLPALPLGAAAGLGLCLMGLWLQGSAQYFVLPAAPLAISLGLCALATLLGFLLPAMGQARASGAAPAMTRQRVKLRKRLRLALPIQPMEPGLLALCLVFILGCVGFAHWMLLPYQYNKDRAAINVTANSAGTLQPNLLADLRAIPQVREVSALSRCPNEAQLSSPQFAQSEMLQALYENSSLDQTGQLRMRSAEGLAASFWSAEPGLLETLAGLCEDPAAARQALAQENAVILYLPYLERDSESGAYGHASFQQGDTWEAADTGIGAGQTLALSLSNYIQGQDGEYEERAFTQDVRIAGIIRKFSPALLAVNNTPVSILSVFTGRGLWAAANKAIGYPDMAEGYTNVNIRLAADAGFSTRQSIAAIAQKRGGLIRANSYDLVEQAYQTGMQGAFLFGVGAVLVGVMGMLLMQNVYLSRLEGASAGLGLRRALGAGRRAIRRAYGGRAGSLCGAAIAAATLLAAVAQWAIHKSNLLLKIQTVFTMGGGMLGSGISTYPWPLHGAICAAVAAYVFATQLAPLGALLKKPPMENMKGI